MVSSADPSDVQDLRPWLALVSPARQGVLRLAGSRLPVLSMYEHGAIMDVAGGSKALTSSREVRKPAERLVGPLAVVGHGRRADGPHHARVDPLMTKISLKGKQVVLLRATGAWAFAGESALTALDVRVELARLPGETLNPLLALWSQTRIDRAYLDGHVDVVADESRFRWEVDIRSQGLHLQLPEETTVTPPWTSDQAGRRIQPIGAKLRLDRLHVQVMERRRPVVVLSLDRPSR